MALGGAGAILKVRAGDLNPGTDIGDQTGLDGAKTYVGALGGAVHMGPGLEALVLGAFASNVALVQYLNTGRIRLSRLAIADGADPTKNLLWDLTAIAAATDRTVIVRNHGGYLLLPAGQGTVGQFLRSQGAGAQPDWAAVAVTNALLDGANHTDTLAEAVLTGALIHGNGTPKWARLPIGAAGQVLTVVGGLPAWSSQPSAVEHNALFHLKPFLVANCTWTNSSDLIQTTADGFADVKVGDFVICGNNSTAGNIGRRVIALNSPNEIQVSATNGGTTLSGVTLIIQPGDHWDDALAQDSFGAGVGLLFAAGRGTYSATGPGATFQEMRGPTRWMSHGSGSISSDFRVQGSTSTATPFGFCLDNPGANRRAYFHINDLTGTKVLRLGDPTNASFFFFSSAGKAYLDDSLMGAARTLTLTDLAGQITVRNAEGNHTGQSAAIGSTTLATTPPAGVYRVSAYLRCSTAGAGNTVLRISWNDGIARTNQVVATLDMTGTNYAQATFVIYVASGSVTYDVTYGGGGSEVYDARIRMEAI